MKAIFIIVFVAVVFQNVSLLQLAYRNVQQRIVGGQQASEGQFPHQVSLLKVLNATHYYHACGGSIFRRWWILTAAHCVIGDHPSQFLVLAGTNIIGGGSYSVYEVSKLIWHRQYNKTYEFSHDIALIQTKTEIIMGTKVQRIALATKDYPPGTELQVSGWGLLAGNATSRVLQWLTVYLKDIVTCKRDYKAVDSFVHPRKQLCTNLGAGKGVCSGDSGGALVFNGTVQLGIVSWGVPCARGYSDVYTNVLQYKPWIKRILSRN